MNPERLAELRRQRDLVRDHLAWLEREIAGESAPPPTVVAVEPTTADALATAASASLRAAEIYRPDPAGASRATRRGCLLLALAALVLGTLTLTAIYFIGYRDRGLIRSERRVEQPAAPTPADAAAPVRR